MKLSDPNFDDCNVVRINGRAYVPAEDLDVLRDQYDRHVARHIEEKRTIRSRTLEEVIAKFDGRPAFRWVVEELHAMATQHKWPAGPKGDE